MPDPQVATFLRSWEGSTTSWSSRPSPKTYSSLSDILETRPDLQKYCLSPKAASGILRRAERRERVLPETLRMALEALAQQLPPSRAVPFLAHTLTSAGADASEDRIGRGLPMVAFGLRVSGPGQSGTAQGWNTNLLPVDLAQVTSKENRSNPQPGDPAGTLASTGRPAVAFGETQDMAASEGLSPSVRTGTGGSQVGVAVPAAAVRRLTPVECERLQGFPDGWTARRVDLVLEGNRWTATGKAVGQADSARYRQLGNSIAGPVFEWVAEGIVMVDDNVGCYSVK